MTLSDKIHNARIPEADIPHQWLFAEDVKAFIKELKDKLHDLHDMENLFNTDDFLYISKKIDELAGDKLVGGERK